MRALIYRKSVPHYLAGMLASRLAPRRFFPALAPLALAQDAPEPDRAAFGSRAHEFAVCRVRMCGICGSDLNLLRARESLLLEPYASFPAVLGHEVLAEIVTPPADSSFLPGQRVVIEPVLHCAVRGLAPCEPCRRGETNLCERYTEGDIAPGVVLGYNATLGGGMAELCMAHRAMLHPVPEAMPDEQAILTDALASALQPVLDNFPEDHETVLILGMGIIGQCLLRSLRALGSRARLVVVARRGFQRDLALAGGADQVLMGPNLSALGAALGARLLKTTLGGGNLEGGCHRVFDCVGSSGSVQQSLLALRARGRYVMVGTAGTLSKADVSSLWFRELTMTGTACYGQGVHRGQMVRTYALALELLAGPHFPAEGLLTHTFPLQSWKDAFTCVFDKKTNQSMKVAFDMRHTNSSQIPAGQSARGPHSVATAREAAA
ncbi:zinc-dependent alcohol dehydrogenase [Megalodesulfovibrio paquesii]